MPSGSTMKPEPSELTRRGPRLGALSPWPGPRRFLKNSSKNSRSEEHTSELQSLRHLVCRLLLEKKNHETNINIIARRTGKDVNSHTVLDGIITTIMATIQRINIIGRRACSRNRKRLQANQTVKK